MGRLHQHHLVERPDVDPQLEGGGGDDALELAALEPLLHDLADLPGQRAVVGVDQLAAGRVVEEAGELLHHPARVAEHQRRAVGPHPAQHLVHERRPVLARLVPGGLGRGGGREAHLQVVALRLAALQHPHRARLQHAEGVVAERHRAAHPARHLVEGPHRGRERHPLHLAGQAHQPLDRRDEVDAALGLHHRVHLVEDHALHPRRGPPARPPR